MFVSYCLCGVYDFLLDECPLMTGEGTRYVDQHFSSVSGSCKMNHRQAEKKSLLFTPDHIFGAI